jgi:GNAT superfamily N-acetyltransferase
MSRVLPARPNLDHLKKQAKDLLPELQEKNPGARLADAQHLVAREYGFQSWPRLKEHLLGLADSPFAGRWIANLAKSQRHPANLFRSATLQIDAIGDSLTMVDSFVMESGDTHEGRNTIQPRRIGTHAVEAVAHHGAQEVRVRYEVSADGKTLTASDPAGAMRIVFDKEANRPFAAMTIRPCEPADVAEVHAVINDAAVAYRGVIAADCWHEPYMSLAELQHEIAGGVRFWGCVEGGQLVGVMGLQDVADVTLVRHAYTRTVSQGAGVGSALLNHLRVHTDRRILIGTWKAATWAVKFYQRHGFRLVPEADTPALLRRYWTVSPRQIEESVVLVGGEV